MKTITTKKFAIFLILAMMIAVSCASVTDSSREATAVDGGMTRVQYIVCGDAYGVSMAFHSQMGPLDSIPGAILPVIMDFVVPIGTEAFIRAHKFNDDDIVTVLIISGGIVTTDTARPGDHTAEATVQVWR